MLVILNDEIFNLSAFDSVKPMDECNDHNDRISFFRDYDECEYVAYDTPEERDREWNRIKRLIEKHYG